MKGAFADYHPMVNFVYFMMVFLCAVFFMHPACLAISLTSGFYYAVMLRGRKAVRLNVVYLLPMMLAAALINPAFNHEGVTILTYLDSGNPLTLESIAYGVAASTMLASVVWWFYCYHIIMTSDKFIYLFGRVIPALSLMLSMVLRFVPVFKAQIKVIADAQKCVGRDVTSGSIIQRAQHGIRILSIMVTWALENAIDTADAMRARGYGLPGRTAFSIYRFDKRDKKALLMIGITGLYVLVGALLGGVYFRYFPSIKGVALTPFSMSVFGAYGILCITPIVIERWESKKWQLLQSKI